MPGVSEWSGHPAVRAWHRQRPRRHDPEVVETLVHTRKTSVFRLVGAGPGGAAVIGKRCRHHSARVERIIYEAYLSRLKRYTLHYYGSVVDEDPAFEWLFLEDAGGEPYSAMVEEHRTAAAQWLAVLHTSAWSAEQSTHLPDVGAAYYRQHLLSACDRIRMNRSNPNLEAEDRAMLDDLTDACHGLACSWEKLQAMSQRLPQTLVHGDFVEKNLRVRNEANGTLLLPFDWDMAGWGPPLADLAECPDLRAYYSAVRRTWPDLCLDELRRLADCGKVFRLAAAVSWASWRLAFAWNNRALHCLRSYATELPKMRRVLAIGG